MRPGGSDQALEAQIEPWRLTLSSGGSDSALETQAQIESRRLRLSPGGSDSALETQIEPGGSD